MNHSGSGTVDSSADSSDNISASTSASITVEVWFDVRCPWCYVGKRRLERAVELFHVEEPGVPVTIRHHSFELAPGIPERFDGGEAEYLLTYEGVPLEQSKKALPALRALAESEGVILRFDDLREVNTRRAHRVFQVGERAGLGEELLEHLFHAYFTECQDLADTETLVRIAAAAGLDSREDQSAVRVAADEADDGEWNRAVSKDHVRGEMLGATGVPFAFVNGKYRVSGAQSAEVLAAAFRKLVELEGPSRHLDEPQEQ